MTNENRECGILVRLEIQAIPYFKRRKILRLADRTSQYVFPLVGYVESIIELQKRSGTSDSVMRLLQDTALQRHVDTCHEVMRSARKLHRTITHRWGRGYRLLPLEYFETYRNSMEYYQERLVEHRVEAVQSYNDMLDRAAQPEWEHWNMGAGCPPPDVIGHTMLDYHLQPVDNQPKARRKVRRPTRYEKLVADMVMPTHCQTKYLRELEQLNGWWRRNNSRNDYALSDSWRDVS